MISALICILLFHCLPGNDDNAVAADPLQQGKEWCDTTVLDAMEGIWYLPEDQIYILMRRDTPATIAGYTLTVLTALDANCLSGETIGFLKPTASDKTFTASLPTKRKGGKPSDFKSCMLTLADNGNALIISATSSPLKFSFTPLSLLPHFWKMVRLSFQPQQLKTYKGMVKVYPDQPDGNPNKRNPLFL